MDSEKPQAETNINAVLQSVLNAYQNEFRSAIARSSEALRIAIGSAHQSISQQIASLARQNEEQARVNLEAASTAMPISDDAVKDLFSKARETLNQLERDSAAALANAIKARTTDPTPAVSADPLEAASQIMLQATQVLETAVQDLIDSMNRINSSSDSP